MTQDILTDQEKEKVIQFNQDEVMKEAVRKVFLKVLYTQGTLRKGVPANPLSNGAFGLAFHTINGSVVSDEQLGADLRGMAHGVNYLEAGFVELAKVHKGNEELPEEVNPGI